MVDIVRHKIQPVNTTNYSISSKKLQLLLRGKGLWDTVIGQDVFPASGSPDTQRRFQQRADLALTDILLSIEDNCSHSVITMDDPRLVWEKLQDMYKGVSDACIDTYLVKLQGLRMHGDEKVMAFVNRLVKLESDLASVGHSLHEKEKSRALLRGLRGEFETTAKVMRAVDMSFTKDVAELIVEEGSLEVAETTDGSSAPAMATVSSGKLRCSQCGRDGHTADRCFHNPACSYYRKDISIDAGKRNKRKTKSFGNQKRKPKNVSSHDKDIVANMALMSKSVLHGDVLATSAMKKKWMIDSVSTSHICNNEMHFESLTKQPRRPVKVGEGQHVVVAGIGNVRGTAVVDGKQHEVVMKDVFNVPTMMCNLISVGKARRTGF